MREPVRKEIGGVHFEVTPLGYRAAQRVLLRVTSALGAAVKGLGTLGGSTDALLSGGMDAELLRVLASIFSEVSEADLTYLEEELSDGARYSFDGGRKWPRLDGNGRERVFSERGLLLFYQWLWFALEVNFSDFLSFARSAKPARDLDESETPGSTSCDSPESERG